MKKMILLFLITGLTLQTYPINLFRNRLPRKETIKNNLTIGSYVLGASAALSWLTQQNTQLTENLVLLAAGTSLLSQGLQENVQAQTVPYAPYAAPVYPGYYGPAYPVYNANQPVAPDTSNHSHHLDLNIPYGCLLSYYGTKKLMQEALNSTAGTLVAGSLIAGACGYLGYKYGPRVLNRKKQSHNINQEVRNLRPELEID